MQTSPEPSSLHSARGSCTQHNTHTPRWGRHQIDASRRGKKRLKAEVVSRQKKQDTNSSGEGGCCLPPPDLSYYYCRMERENKGGDTKWDKGDEKKKKRKTNKHTSSTTMPSGLKRAARIAAYSVEVSNTPFNTMLNTVLECSTQCWSVQYYVEYSSVESISILAVNTVAYRTHHTPAVREAAMVHPASQFEQRSRSVHHLCSDTNWRSPVGLMQTATVLQEKASTDTWQVK